MMIKWDGGLLERIKAMTNAVASAFFAGYGPSLVAWDIRAR